MKKLKFSSIFLLFPLLVGFTSPNGDKTIVLEDFMFEPLIVHQDNELSFGIKLNSLVFKNVFMNLYLTNETYDNYMLDRTSFMLAPYQRKQVTFTIPAWTTTVGLNYFKLRVTYEGNVKELNFALGANYRGVVTLPTTSIVREAYWGVIYKNSEVQSFNYLFDYRTYTNELRLRDDLFLDLSLFEVPFIQDYFTYDSARLIFTNMNTLFPRLMRTSEGYPYLDLEITCQHGLMQFKPAMQLYVDDETHMLSLVKEDGYRLTSTIYLPKHYKEDLTFNKLRLEIDGFSPLRIDIRYDFLLVIDQNYLGRNGTFILDYRW